MKWLTLFNKIGKQPIKITSKSDVYALLQNPKTGEFEKVYLKLEFDAHVRPYLVIDPKHKENTI